MPKLSDSMEMGKIIQWKVKEGDQVGEGDVLAEVESDKAVMELESFREGTVAEIRHADGEEVPVGQVIAVIRLAGEGPEAAPGKRGEPRAAAAQKPPAAKAPAAEVARRPAAGTEEAAAKAKGAALPSAPTTAPRAGPGLAEPRRTEAPRAGARVAISPYARKLAADKGVDYSAVKGTGPGGRITARDIERAAGAGAAVAQEAPPAAARAVKPSPDEELPAIEVAEGEADVEEASFRLRTQARRVVASQHVIPHFYVTVGANVAALFARKDELKAGLGATVTHLVAYACVQALKQHPEINWSYDRGRVIKWKGVHLGLAVETPQGLTVAVLRDAQKLSLRELVAQATALVERARAGRLGAQERRHPTFTITNLGMFGVEHFEPIINPPSSVTLAVSSALPAALVKDAAIHIGMVMKLTAACDHRIIDGAAAARFLSDLRALLESPDRLLGGQ
jgi:pyruvate dehydrogenase E2 component (dihydrolipoamide acetyltransferase)